MKVNMCINLYLHFYWLRQWFSKYFWAPRLNTENTMVNKTDKIIILIWACIRMRAAFTKGFTQYKITWTITEQY